MNRRDILKLIAVAPVVASLPPIEVQPTPAPFQDMDFVAIFEAAIRRRFEESLRNLDNRWSNIQYVDAEFANRH